MQSERFDCCYSEISRLGATKLGHREGYGMLPPKVIKLLNSLEEV